ncbi:Hydroxylase/desaturase CTB9 [Psilocybe cubensis]|uniref:Hydroxylase/desaturase CTB9 n=1 Tax=Psilocybe cubensis TaxID=181762 RepID=A0ACB8GL92_PSICU|nr:Hydroxylase/desaturase CTB9 [Psilocybe cubensis]KAH9476167.1 Hydroxylase/desaturase CTB9 [Psilocybe cubensis]
MPGLTSPVSVTTTLHYFTPPAGGERAYQKALVDPVTGERTAEKNFDTEERPNIVIENLRGREDSVSLDKTGFQYFIHPPKHTSFTNDDEIKAEYYPESIELIKKLTGATRVVIFDHTLRRRIPGQKSPFNAPVAQVHVDQSSKASIARVHRHLPPSDVPQLLEKRFQIINLWRPIKHAALDWPLALCDHTSVDPADIVPVALIYPDREGETLGVKYNPNHKWKYLRGMTPEEGVLIKCFDSIQDGSVAVFTPHTGFEDPSTPEGAPFRESIEIRTLVFYD